MSEMRLQDFKPSSKIFYWPFLGDVSFVDLLCFCSVICLLCLCARLFICALWSPAGKGLTSWLSFVVSNCEFVTFPLVSWVRCGTWLYRLLIFAPLLTSFQSNLNVIWYIESNIHALVLFNLLNLLRKRDKRLGKPGISSLFPNLFNKFSEAWAHM